MDVGGEIWRNNSATKGGEVAYVVPGDLEFDYCLGEGLSLAGDDAAGLSVFMNETICHR